MRIAMCVCAVVAMSNLASAQEENSFQIGLGAGLVPDYEGANEYGFIPLPSFDLRYEGFGLRTSKLGVEADLVPVLGIDAGPIVRYNMGRKNVKDDVVDLLPEVDGSIELGGFIGAGLPLSFLGGSSDAILFGKIAGIQGLDGGHEGFVWEGSLGLLAPVGEKLTVISVLSSSYMSSDYADSFFSVSPAGAAASGLASYNADAGIKDVSVSLIGRYKWDDNWSTTFIGSYSHLVGDAAKSPIVDDRGSRAQIFAGISLGYTF